MDWPGATWGVSRRGLVRDCFGTDPAVVAVVVSALTAQAVAMLARFTLPPPLGEIVAQVVRLGIPKLAHKLAGFFRAKWGKKEPAVTPPPVPEPLTPDQQKQLAEKSRKVGKEISGILNGGK